MARVKRICPVLTRWSLFLLLVFSQAALLVHEADIDHYLEAEDCLVCLLGSGHDDAVTADSEPQQLRPDVALACVPASVDPRSFRVLAQQPRAPPFNTLHV